MYIHMYLFMYIHFFQGTAMLKSLQNSLGWSESSGERHTFLLCQTNINHGGQGFSWTPTVQVIMSCCLVINQLIAIIRKY